ncbi:MAG TPA: SAM-dependent methyltransferase [Terriglobales bacterium]|nr:SAM-dependent methyltransferase [Terriglobales bacterium]
MTLREYIENEIRNHGPMPFSRYMQICLYGEAGSPPGFYTRNREQFGKAGDFYTSSDVHAVFGRLLARQFEEMWRELNSPDAIDVIELGPGRGLFAQDVLDWAGKKYPEFAKAIRYRFVETSASLRDRLKERFAEHSAVSVYEFPNDAFCDSGANVIVFANEFFDAIPAEVLDSRGQLYVDIGSEGFVECFKPPSDVVTSFAKSYAVVPQQNERVDAPIFAQSYMQAVAEQMHDRTGFVVAIDYGYVQEEMFAGRHMGSVTAFRQHTISDSPYEAPGDQDITVHVNFTALAGIARANGLEPIAWITQAQFLMGIGEESQFSEAFEGCKLPQEHAKRALQLKHLITPEGMGESFHVLLLSSNVEKAKAAQLSGLKFVRPSNSI